MDFGKKQLFRVGYGLLIRLQGSDVCTNTSVTLSCKITFVVGRGNGKSWKCRRQTESLQHANNEPGEVGLFEFILVRF